MNDSEFLEEEDSDTSQIIWNRKGRYAIIAFLLLSIDKKMGAGEMKKLEAFMGITKAEAESDDENDEEDSNSVELRATRDAIIREGNAFLDNIDQNEDRYDCIIDELCCVIDGYDRCSIGSGYALNSKNGKRVELKGDANRLFEYLNLIIFDDGYSGNHRRFLQNLARKWDIDKSATSILESSSKTLAEINQKREGIQNSDMPHREAVSALAKLDEQEKSVWEKLNKLGIRENEIATNYNEAWAGFLSAFSNLTDNPVKEDEIMDDFENDEEPTLVDKIGDGIVEGIMKVGELICAPFEWLSGVR